MKKILCRAWLWLGLPAAALAVDLPPPTVPPAREAVSVAGMGLTARFAVDRLKSTILPGDELGHLSSGIFCIGRQPVRANDEFVKNIGAGETGVATQQLKKLGYPMASTATSAYSSDVAAAPDYRVGGIVRELKFETCNLSGEAEGWFYIKVDWALYAEREQKVVFQLVTEGLAVSSKRVPDLWRRAVTASVDNFLGAPGFLAAIRPDGAAPPAAGAASAPRVAAAAPAAAAAAGPPSVAVLAPLKADGEGLQVRLGVDPVKVGMLQGDDLGRSSVGGFCVNPQPLAVSETFIKSYGNLVAAVVQQSLKKNGYPLANQARTSAFDNEQAAAPDFRVGGVLRQLRMDTCRGDNTAEGWVYARIDWALYSEKARRVVLERTTEGYAASKDKVPDLQQRALTVAVENLLAAPELLQALKAAPVAVAATSPAASAAATASASAGTAAAPAVTATVAAAPQGAAAGAVLQLAPVASAPGGAQKNQARLRAAVVTLETAGGTGSGFYIDRQGWLLTNFHVVSGAKFVKVKLLNGDRLVAEVVKVSERDDVALLKSLPVDFEPLAVRPDMLDVGEEVYAIGTPLGVLTSTMTRGVLSADRVSQGVHELQSDAAVTFGSSGGPLLDGEGRVIGITKSGLRGEKGFNFFIPVHDALKAVGVAPAAR